MAKPFQSYYFNTMKTLRRRSFKQSLSGILAIGMLCLPFQHIHAEELSGHNESPTRVVLLSLDGISVEGFQKAHTPHLDSLLAQGVLSLETRVVMPSITLPNWTSHLTGSGPEQHGVTDNAWTFGKAQLPAVDTDKDGYYPSVFQQLKIQKQQIKTAFYYNWANLIYPYNQKYLDEISFLEKDAYIPNYEKAFSFMKKNRHYPTLVYLYSVHTDHAGHQYKWMSPEYIRSIEEADKAIGWLLEHMKKERLTDHTYFFFLTDHGGVEYGHGGLSTTEMIVPWGIIGPGIRKGIKMQEPNNTVNTAALILHLFGAEKPHCWTGEVPESIFEIKQ